MAYAYAALPCSCMLGAGAAAVPAAALPWLPLLPACVPLLEASDEPCSGKGRRQEGWLDNSGAVRRGRGCP